MIGWELWFTGGLLIAMSVLLALEWVEVEILLFGVLLLLLITNVITPDEAFGGFSNEGVLTIALLFVVVGAVSQTGILSRLDNFILGKGAKSTAGTLVRLMLPVSFISAFINNTPVVAMMIPLIRSWVEKHDQAISKFLIPLSYAAILGGMCTLIGTSTNLIVYGLMIDHGMRTLGFFEIAKIGDPATIAGIAFVALVGQRLLPARQEAMVQLGGNTREFVIELRVTDAYENIGKTIEAAGLRHLKGLFLFQIERSGHIIAPARPNEVILKNDRLFFTGLPRTIIQLQKTPGLVLTEDSHFNLKYYDSSEIRPFECVISANSPLIGKNVRESHFRSKYGAVILAIHRQGERIQKKIGDIVLKTGDTLLLLADRDFRERWYHSKDFYLIAGADEVPSKTRAQGFVALIIFLGVVLLVSLGIMSLLTAAAAGVGALLLTRIMRPFETRRLIDWRVIVVIALSLGIAEAMETSGLANVLAEWIVSLSARLGNVGVLITIYVITSVYTTLITNNAAAALIFPIAYSSAQKLGADPHAFVIAVMIAAAGSFATPISYQTNLMVYGPGGYRFRDFLRVGVPLQILVGIIALILLQQFYL